MPDDAHHMIRDGDYHIIYISGNKGLYKLFTDTNTIKMMKAVAVGEQGHMVGYSQLVVPEVPAALWLGTRDRAHVDGGGIWKWSQDTGWIRPANIGLPDNGDWYVVANPNNGDDLLALTGDQGVYYPVRNSMCVISTTEQVTPLYRSTDGGENWTPIAMSATGLNQYSGFPLNDLSWAHPTIDWTDDDRMVAFCVVEGIGNFFGVSRQGPVAWRGGGSTLANIMGMGTNQQQPTALVSGHDGEMILGVGGSYYVLSGTDDSLSVARVMMPSYAQGSGSEGDVHPNTNQAVFTYVVDYNVAVHQTATADYRTTGTTNRAGAQVDTQGDDIVIAADGVYVTGLVGGQNHGVYKNTDYWGSGSWTLSKLGPSGMLRVARQGQRTRMAARLGAEAGTNYSQFSIYTGAAWVDIQGPHMPNGNVKSFDITE